jgi:uncharacterized OB-fold protein
MPDARLKGRLPAQLIRCPSCGLHAYPTAQRCPHCKIDMASMMKQRDLSVKKAQKALSVLAALLNKSEQE